MQERQAAVDTRGVLAREAEGNVERDRRAIEALQSNGWRVLTCWECATRDAEIAAAMPAVLSNWIEGGDTLGEISAAKPG